MNKCSEYIRYSLHSITCLVYNFSVDKNVIFLKNFPFSFEY